MTQPPFSSDVSAHPTPQAAASPDAPAQPVPDTKTEPNDAAQHPRGTQAEAPESPREQPRTADESPAREALTEAFRKAGPRGLGVGAVALSSVESATSREAKHHAQRWQKARSWERAPAWAVPASVLCVGSEFAGMRLDQAAAPLLGSARAVREALVSGQLFYNGASPFGAARLAAGDVLCWFAPEDDPNLRAEALSLPVLYEDEHFLAVLKPAGVPMYPGPGWPCRTVANGVRALGPVSALKGALRAGILGRLDREVSGVIVSARDEAVHADVISQYVRHEVRRRYLALVAPVDASAEARLEGRSVRWLLTRREGKSGYRAVPPGTPYAIQAETAWRPIGRCGAAWLLEVSPVTGRRHQIRVHLAAEGLPILGDRQYAGELGRLRDRGGLWENYPAMHRVALHLETLSFTHPARKERLQIRAPWPEDLPRVTLFAGESLAIEEEAGEVA